MIQVKRVPALLNPRVMVAIVVTAAAVAWMAQNSVLAGNADPWQVTGVEGRAWVNHDDAGWRALKPGAVLKAGDRAETGMNGRIELSRPGDSMMVAPNSRFRLPAANQMGPAAQIMQSLGTLRFRIAARERQEFKVRTPYLTAATRGTDFTVTVGAEISSLSVAEGMVRAVSTLSGESVVLRSGASAMVDPATGGRMRYSDDGRFPVKSTGNSAPPKLPVKPVVKPVQPEDRTPAPSSGKTEIVRWIEQSIFDGVAVKLAGFDPGAGRGGSWRLQLSANTLK